MTPEEAPILADADPGSIVHDPGTGPVPWGDAWLQTVFDRLFPEAGLARRDEQLAMAHQVEAGLESGRHVLAEAGVGAGKTLAYLIPLVGHLLRHGGPVVIATHTIALQDQLIRENIPQLAALLDAPIEAVLAKGRHHYLCPARLAELRDDGPDAARLRAWAAETGTSDRAELGDVPDALWERVNWGRTGPCAARCHHADTCPSARHRQRFHETRGILVTNHHQFFADLALRAEGHPLFLAPTAVVLDEAHAMADAAVEAFGCHTTLAGLDAAISGASSAFPPGDDTVGMLLDAFDAFKAALAPRVAWAGGEGERFGIDPDEALTAAATRLHQGAGLVLAYLAEEKHRAAEPLRRAIAPLAGLDRPDAMLAWAEGRRGEVTGLEAVPRDLTGILGSRLFGAGIPVVCTSATLAVGGDFGWFRRRAGLGEALEVQVGSPFDHGQQARLYMPADLPDPRDDEDAFYAAALERLQGILEATDGRALVLFTARSRADAAYDALRAWGRFPVHRQGGAGKRAVDRFKRDTRSVLVGTGFWEGLDVPGESLSCVVLVKLPFPAGDPLVAAREADARAAGEDPFEAVLLPEMLIKLRQGAGRAIRGADDRGVIVVLDPRAVTREGYAGQVRAALPPAPEVTSLDAIRAFLQAGD